MPDNSDQFPAYIAAIRLTLDNGHASITKESARIRETLAGKVGDDGRIVLEGTGLYKVEGGPNWRYRFEGRFEGRSFDATGMMLTAGRGTKLRDCSMGLTRVSSSQQAKQQAAPAKRQTDKMAAAKPQAAPAKSEPQTTAAPKPQPTPPPMQTPAAPAPRVEPAPPASQSPTAPAARPVEPSAAPPAVAQQVEHSGSAKLVQLGTRADVAERVARARALLAELEASGKSASGAAKATPSGQFAAAPAAGLTKQRELDLSGENRSAAAEGIVAHEAADRYYVLAKKANVLTAELQSEGDGARVEVYEPGATAKIVDNALVVEGNRLQGKKNGAKLEVTLAGDGKYLVLVRATRDGARYTLNIALTESAAAADAGAAQSSGVNRTLVAMLLGVGVLTAAAFAARKRWMCRVTRAQGGGMRQPRL